MKKTRLSIYVAVCCASLLTLFSCGSPSNKIDASESQALAENSSSSTRLAVDLTNSQVMWTGFKPGGSHHGTLAIKAGELFINGTTLESGSFTFDMNGIVCADVTDKGANEKLVGHLKSPDFFDVAKYPEGKFSITKVENFVNDSTTHRISGNLQLKGVEKNIIFTAKITQEGENYKAVVKPFSINRTQWGVNYGSKNIFKDLKDTFIDDDIEIGITIIAKQAS